MRNIWGNGYFVKVGGWYHVIRVVGRFKGLEIGEVC